MGFDGRFLTQNGRPFEKDFLRQAKFQAVQISEVLVQKFGLKIFVKPILVFANYSKMKFGTEPVEGVFVVGEPFLLNLIQSQPAVYFKVPLDKIASELKKLIN